MPLTLSLMMGGYDPFLKMGWAYHPMENCRSLSLASTWVGSVGSRGSDHSPLRTIPTRPEIFVLKPLIEIYTGLKLQGGARFVPIVLPHFLCTGLMYG